MSGGVDVIAEFREEVARLREEVFRLREENAGLRVELAKRDRQIEVLRAENETLKRLLEESRREGKRQAAPFSKGPPKTDPKKPGRKPGKGYGRQAVRPVPARVDETIEVPALLVCPTCSGRTRLEDVVEQYQIDLPRIEPNVIWFRGG